MLGSSIQLLLVNTKIQIFVALFKNLPFAIFFLQIFEKALEEPKYSSLYAQLCHRLCEDSPNFDTSSNVTVSILTTLDNHM